MPADGECVVALDGLPGAHGPEFEVAVDDGQQPGTIQEEPIEETRGDVREIAAAGAPDVSQFGAEGVLDDVTVDRVTLDERQPRDGERLLSIVPEADEGSVETMRVPAAAIASGRKGSAITRGLTFPRVSKRTDLHRRRSAPIPQSLQ